MDTTQQVPSSVAERFAQIEPGNFREEIQRRWQAADQVKDLVCSLVEDGQIQPLEGAGIVSCVTGQVFGYAAFHGEPTTAELLSKLSPALRGSSN